MVIENIGNPVVESYIFFIIFFVAILVYIRGKRKEDVGFPPSLTNELKGWATIFVVASHIGYFLFANHQFLYPLSNIAGVGVDLFLFLSGFGLVSSAYRKPLSIAQFYKKRLSKIFISLWLVLIGFLLLDKFLLNITYPWPKIVESFLGIFRTADIFNDINSPLWYLTFIFGYYLTFPLIFMSKRPLVSALLWFLLGYGITKVDPSLFSGVMHLYAWHIIAFPLGVWFAGWMNNPPVWLKKLSSRIKAIWLRLPVWLRWFFRFILLIAAAGAICFWTINPGVGSNKWILQSVSLATVLAIILVAWLKPFRFRLVEHIGVYSYEIYLLHWPLLYRYDFIFNRLPAGVATAVTFLWLLVVSVAFNWVANLLYKKILHFK